MKTYEKLEREAADLLVECGRLRRENARLRRRLQECREHVLAAVFACEETRLDIMEQKGLLK